MAMNIRRPRVGILFGIGILVITSIFYAAIFADNGSESTETTVHQDDVDRLLDQVKRLNDEVHEERRKIEALGRRLEKALRADRHLGKYPLTEPPRPGRAWSEPIAVLVFVCNRAEAIRGHLEKLIRYRTSATHFPIVVSQDCDNEDVANTVKSFGDQVQYIKHTSPDKAGLTVPPEHKKFATYYRIARHYKLGLEHVFREKKFGSVIITEDDLDIAPDFFDFFAGTRWLLEEDKSLFCVSAWNDNGKAALIDRAANTQLYRSDFFPGLGWMMTSELWEEFGPSWPTGFWDDWMREPQQRKGRGCIRPEVSRTAMTTYGKKGASRGLFFNNHLKQIVLNEAPVNFSRVDLSYLLKDRYDDAFLQRVYALPLTHIDAFLRDSLAPTAQAGAEFRVEYRSMREFTDIAKRLRIMADTKAGVPRTAYLGVVTAFVNRQRVHIAPADHRSWPGYDKAWEPPPDAIPPGD
ncbi:Protein GLY-13 [Aphelenchoides avenae]|nr:Protein GLY-13 [Aphelenchus avenae]